MVSADASTSEPGPSKPTANGNSTVPNNGQASAVEFVIPPDPSASKAQAGNFSFVTSGSSLPPREIEAFPPSRKTGVVYDAQMMLHAPLHYDADIDWENSSTSDVDQPLSWHPEDPRRIQRIYDQLQQEGLTKQMLPLPCPPVSVADILLVHSEALWHKVEKTQCKRLLICMTQESCVLIVQTAMLQMRPTQRSKRRQIYTNTTLYTSISIQQKPLVYRQEVLCALLKRSSLEKSRMLWQSCVRQVITQSQSVVWGSLSTITLQSLRKWCKRSWV
jgi:hypothetical protein